MNTFMETTTEIPANPTASMYIDGLAILCFSIKYNRAEVGFLQVRNHPLLFTIYDKNCVARFRTPFNLHSGTTIKINHNNPGLGKLYVPSRGDEPKDSDDSDFRHLLNIDKLHADIFQDSQRVVLKPDFYLAKLYLSQGIFLSRSRSKNKAKIINARVIAERPNIRKPMPRVGRVIGAEIFNDEVVVEVSSLHEPIRLRKDDANGPYTIVIRYKCNRRANIKTDFEQFYRVLGLPPGHQALDLEFDDVEERKVLKCEVEFLEKSLSDEKISADSDRARVFSLFRKNLLRAEEACQGAVKPKCPDNLQGDPEPCE